MLHSRNNLKKWKCSGKFSPGFCPGLEYHRNELMSFLCRIPSDLYPLCCTVPWWNYDVLYRANNKLTFFEPNTFSVPDIKPCVRTLASLSPPPAKTPASASVKMRLPANSGVTEQNSKYACSKLLMMKEKSALGLHLDKKHVLFQVRNKIWEPDRVILDCHFHWSLVTTHKEVKVFGRFYRLLGSRHGWTG